MNNILPDEDQFYDKDTDIADYDFFSANAMSDAKELADIFYKKGFTECEAKAGSHHGTYNVFVNFIGIADITQIPKPLFAALKKDAIRVAGILYAPPNFLRMSIYLELSRPAGDVDRWTKVWERLQVLNKNYPLLIGSCNDIEFQREMENPDKHEAKEAEIYDTLKDTLINQGVVFFGGYAISEYSKYMPKSLQKKLAKIPDFDVIARHPKTVAEIIRERLHDINIKDVKILKRNGLGEIIPDHYEVIVGNNDSLVYIYEPIACHSYNVINVHGKKVRIATIDTMLSFYLSFLFGDAAYYKQFKERLLCMAKFLFDVQQKNRLKQKGLLKRFSILCYGHQLTLEEMRAEKTKKFKELKKGSKEYNEWFLRYRPGEDTDSVTNSVTKTMKTTGKEKALKKKRKTQRVHRRSTFRTLFNI